MHVHALYSIRPNIKKCLLAVPHPRHIFHATHVFLGGLYKKFFFFAVLPDRYFRPIQRNSTIAVCLLKFRSSGSFIEISRSINQAFIYTDYTRLCQTYFFTDCISILV